MECSASAISARWMVDGDGGPFFSLASEIPSPSVRRISSVLARISSVPAPPTGTLPLLETELLLGVRGDGRRTVKNS